MRKVVLVGVLAVGTLGAGCHDASGGPAGGGAGAFGTGGTGGGAGAFGTGGTGGGAGAFGTGGTGGGAAAGGGRGGAGGSGGGTGGGGGAAGGATGGATGAGGAAGTRGAGGACGAPASCEGYDNTPDAGLTAVITCLSPSVVPAGALATVAIYGHHLAIAAGSPAIVTLDNGVPLNGVPATACHLDVQVPATQLSSPRAASVVVSPGSWIRDSAPATLTIQ
jgi:hypothetical protein